MEEPTSSASALAMSIPLENAEGEIEDEREDVYDAVIKVSPSDVEMSDDDEDEEIDDYEKDKSVHFDVEGLSESKSDFEEEEEAFDVKVFMEGGESQQQEESSSEFNQIAMRTLRKRTVKSVVVPVKSSKKKRKSSDDAADSNVPKKRGRKKDPRRLDGKDGSTTEEEEDDQEIPVKAGTGYHVLYKRKVLKYASTHSNSATAEKFGLKTKLVREWRKLKEKIEMECENPPTRRPRGDGYTVEEKLQAVEFATERSVDEARLLYNVDISTIIKWKRHKDKLEARLLNGEGNAVRARGCGSKPKFSHIEESLRDWIVGLRLKGVMVNPRMILDKAKKLLEADSNNDKSQTVRTPRSSTWVEKFLKRHNLTTFLGTTLGHEDPSEIITFQLLHGTGDVTDLANNIDEIPMNPNKRHRRRISLQDKLNIIRRIEEGNESQMAVAKSLKVATSTVQTIWSCRHEILRKSQSPKKISKPKSESLLWKKYSVVAAALQDWYEQQLMPNNAPVNAKVLLQKAIQISETYKLIGFIVEAKDWVKLFCKRRNLKDILAELNGNPNSSNSTYPETNQEFSSAITSPAISNNVAHSPYEDCDLGNTGSDIHDDGFTVAVVAQNDSRSDVASSTKHYFPHFFHQIPPANLIDLRNRHQDMQTTTDQARTSTSSQAAPHTSQNSTTTSSMSIDEALDCINRLRCWINANYGLNEVSLNNNLAVVENAVLKKREF